MRRWGASPFRTESHLAGSTHGGDFRRRLHWLVVGGDASPTEVAQTGEGLLVRRSWSFILESRRPAKARSRDDDDPCQLHAQVWSRSSPAPMMTMTMTVTVIRNSGRLKRRETQEDRDIFRGIFGFFSYYLIYFRYFITRVSNLLLF